MEELKKQMYDTRASLLVTSRTDQTINQIQYVFIKVAILPYSSSHINNYDVFGSKYLCRQTTVLTVSKPFGYIGQSSTEMEGGRGSDGEVDWECGTCRMNYFRKRISDTIDVAEFYLKPYYSTIQYITTIQL